MAPATWRRRFEDRGEAMDPGMAMGSICRSRLVGRLDGAAMCLPGSALCCSVCRLAPRAVAWNRADWRRGSPGSIRRGRACTTWFYHRLSGANPARCKIILASCNTLESWASRVNKGKKTLSARVGGKVAIEIISRMRWVPCARRAALTVRTMRPSTRHRRALAAVDVPQPTTIAADARRRPQPPSPTVNSVAAAAAVVRCSGGAGSAVARLFFEEDDGT